MTGILETDLPKAWERLVAGHLGQTARSEKSMVSPFSKIIIIRIVVGFITLAKRPPNAYKIPALKLT